MAAEGWKGIRLDPATETQATKVADSLTVPGKQVSKAEVLARAVVVGLEEIEHNHARFLSPPRARSRRKRPGPVNAPSD